VRGVNNRLNSICYAYAFSFPLCALEPLGAVQMRRAEMKIADLRSAIQSVGRDGEIRTHDPLHPIKDFDVFRFLSFSLSCCFSRLYKLIDLSIFGLIFAFLGHSCKPYVNR
jgi:hypothetical protein